MKAWNSVGPAGPFATRVMGDIRQRHQQPGALLLDLIGLDLELTDPLPARLVGRKNGRRVETLALGTGHFVAGGILFPLQAFELGNQAAAARFQRCELLELGVGLHAAPGQRRTQDVHLFAEQTWIDHDNSNRMKKGRLASGLSRKDVVAARLAQPSSAVRILPPKGGSHT